MASQNLMTLATALADEFTVYVPDRRGRGLSGPHGDHYCLAREAEDLEVLAARSGATNIFGLSSGAIVALRTAVSVASIQRVALYEPPLAVEGASPADWVARYERELGRGDLAAAMLSVIQGTADSSPLGWLPRWLTMPLMSLAIRAQTKALKGDDVPIRALIPTMHYDPQIVSESATLLHECKNLSSDVLLLGGSKSKPHLKIALDALQRVLPHVTRVELPGVGHLAAENGGKPERVAQRLRTFFRGNCSGSIRIKPSA